MPLPFDELRLKRNEEPTGRHLERLAKLVHSYRRRPGPGVRHTQFPWGIHESFRGAVSEGGVAESTYFRPTVEQAGAEFLVSWERGLIDGAEPTIDGVPISGPQGDGQEAPQFRVGAADFNAAGESNIYFRSKYFADFGLKEIEPFAAPSAPTLAPYQADKLAMILYDDGNFWRALASNLGKAVLNPASNGIAIHTYWSV